MTGETISSTSDDRTQNNATRHQYRKLSEHEKAQMQNVKDLGEMLIGAIYGLSDYSDSLETQQPIPERELELARTHAEDAVMRAVRHITA